MVSDDFWALASGGEAINCTRYLVQFILDHPLTDRTIRGDSVYTAKYYATVTNHHLHLLTTTEKKLSIIRNQ